jgi:hypothetical protein
MTGYVIEYVTNRQRRNWCEPSFWMALSNGNVALKSDQKSLKRKFVHVKNCRIVFFQLKFRVRIFEKNLNIFAGIKLPRGERSGALGNYANCPFSASGVHNPQWLMRGALSWGSKVWTIPYSGRDFDPVPNIMAIMRKNLHFPHTVKPRYNRLTRATGVPVK